MFADIARIKLKAGDGGDGAVHFHREKYVAAGGPDGGDGGRGGSIIFRAEDGMSTLADFRYKRKYTAENGENGSGKRSSGKSAPDLILRIPRGTLVRDAKTGRLIADISDDGDYIIAKGGRGGWGNSHFATATRQCPRFSKRGTPGESLEISLELKLLADVGIIGFPNVGKSTLISVVSGALPKIANYHFTTIIPTLGVVKIDDETSFVLADIPGIIEGAGEGAGLGHEFLRHVDRCRLLIHTVDVSGSEGRDPTEDFEMINRELAIYDENLAKLPQIVAANKCDLASPEQIARFTEYMKSRDIPCFPLMAAIAEGTAELINYTAARLAKLPPVKRYQPDPEPEKTAGTREFEILKENGIFIINAPWLLIIMEDIDPEDYESMQYFQRSLQQSGIISALLEAGVQEGDTVRVGDFEFDYVN